MPLPPDYRKQESLWYCITHRPKGYELQWDGESTLHGDVKPRRGTGQPKKQTGAKRNRSWSTCLSVISAVLSVLGIFLWLPSFRPDIHIEHHGLIDPKQPFRTAFSVTNDGLTSVSEVTSFCRMNDIVFAKGGNAGGGTEWQFLTHRLNRAATVDRFCPETWSAMPDNPVTFADIEIGIVYQLYLMRWETCAHFQTKLFSDHLEWIEVIEDDQRCSNAAKTVISGTSEVLKAFRRKQKSK